MLRNIADFLRDAILGRTLYTDELSYALEGGAIEGVYSDQMTFSNMLASPFGLHFDLFVVSNEKQYVVDKDKRRRELRKDFSGASLFRYELARRKSSGQITGFMRFVSSSLADVPAEAMASSVTRLVFANGELSWREREILYRDQPAADGGHKPVAFEASCRLFLEGGKARYEYAGVCLDVDPDTLERRPSDAVYPQFLAKER